jgi:hypothetical protein
MFEYRSLEIAEWKIIAHRICAPDLENSGTEPTKDVHRALGSKG